MPEELPNRGTLGYRILEAVTDEALTAREIADEVASDKLESVQATVSALKKAGHIVADGCRPGLNGTVSVFRSAANLADCPPERTRTRKPRPVQNRSPRLPLEGTRSRIVLQALQEGPMTSADISARTGCTTQEVSKSLCSLVDRELVRILSSEKKGWTARHTYEALVKVQPLKPSEADQASRPPADLTTEQAINFLEERGYRVIADPLPPKGKGRAYL